ncbi:MAG: ABC transporter permease [Chitinophagales bacterium]|nr:ABC transporter permease [Chitinophagales bacterium]
MKKVWIIIQREYLSRVLTKSFLLTTLLAPIGFIVLIVATVWVNSLGTSEKKIAVIDESGVFKDTRFPDAENKSVYFFYPDMPFDEIYNNIQAEGKAAKFDALLRIPAGFDVMKPNRIGVQLFTAERPGLFMKQYLTEVIGDVVRNKKLQQQSIQPEVVESLNEKIIINYSSGLGNEKAGFTEVASIIGYLIGFIVYIALFVYGSMIMRGVKEEKTNRIVEVLISSVKPFQLMLGKIIGIGMVGLTQFVLWAILITLSNFFMAIVLGITVNSPMAIPASPQAGNIDADEIRLLLSHVSEIHFLPLTLVFLFFFIGGFLLYGALFAAIGAAVNDDGEMQSLTLPVTIPIIVSIVLLSNVIGEPDGNIALWASIVPLSSPIIMPSIMPFEPPLWQILLSAILLVGGFLFTTWLAARIYRTGILMYGKKVTLKELLKWGLKG